ncbi:MAG TPA: lysostaphin resistance A-like protein, partial [Chroococcales cyanobacterium]
MKARHYLWCLLVAGIIGVIFYWHKSENVFPAASIDLRLSRTQVTEIARQWAAKLGYTEKDPKISTVFAFDDDAKTFLEYELGLSKANQLMRTTVPTWYWSTRFLQPLKQEEFTTWISPDGRLTSFEHDIENDRKMTSINHAEAEKLARRFIETEGNVSLEGAKITDQGSISQVHRTDHYFTFEDTKQSDQETLHGAKLRTHIYISGDQVTAYSHYLYVPEAWSRRFSKLRSYNLALEDAASIFYVALNTGTFFVFLWAFASGRIRWRLSLTVASIYAVISLLESLNSWPSSIHEYNTSLPYAGFELEFAISTLTAAVTSFLQILVLVAAGETIYRLSFPNAVSLEKLFTETGLRCRRTLYGIGAGLATFGIHLGWIAAFYLVGRRFGFWCPLEIQNVETLSTAQPFFSAMQVGWLASLTEELTYRIIGLAAFRKLVKNFWVANLLQAAAWGFMHSNYPQEPPYARGLELTIAGFFYGAVLRYFGLLPCIFSHNLLDTFLGLQPLLSSNIGHMKASAYLGLAPFVVLIGISIYLVKRRGFTEDETEETIHNQTVTHSHPPITDTVENILPSGYLYQPLSRKLRWLMVCLVAAGAAVNFCFFAPSVGRSVKLRLNRDEAIGIAHQYLLQQGIRPDGLTTVAVLESGLDFEQMQYIYEKDRARVNELALKPEFPLLWDVRFVKPLVQDEYRVIEDESGHPLSVSITKPEKEAGANLPKEEARKKVEAFLNADHDEIKPFERIEGEDNESKKENRTDYTFQFKVPKYRVGEADYRVNTGMVGDQVSGFDHGWLIPDD